MQRVNGSDLSVTQCEEAFELTNESDFDFLNESIRGEVPEGMFKRFTITMNPWSAKHWIKRRFFDNPDEDTLAMTTTYHQNEWLDESDLKLFEWMKVNNPQRYRTAGLAEWGQVDGLIFNNWVEQEFNPDEILRRPNSVAMFGCDFGYSAPTTVVFSIYDKDTRELFVVDEIYEKNLTNDGLYNLLVAKGWQKERIVCDSADPKSIEELYAKGVNKVVRARKGKDSINFGIQLMQQCRMIIHPRCTNLMTELSNYGWAKDNFGQPTGKPETGMDHCIDALRYSCMDSLRGSLFSFD